MSHLKLVCSDPVKPPRRKGERAQLLSHEEAQRFRQAMRNLRDAFGSWPCLAAAMGVQAVSLSNMMNGHNSVSGDMIVRAMRASGLSLAELLGGVASADRCRACGQVKRGRSAA